MSAPLPPYAHGSATSLAAARGMVSQAQIQREQVLEAISAAGVSGLTRLEIEERTGLRGDCIRPRVWELLGRDALVQPPRIAVSDEIRRNPRGRPMEVLVALPA